MRSDLDDIELLLTRLQRDAVWLPPGVDMRRVYEVKHLSGLLN